MRQHGRAARRPLQHTPPLSVETWGGGNRAHGGEIVGGKECLWPKALAVHTFNGPTTYLLNQKDV